MAHCVHAGSSRHCSSCTVAVVMYMFSEGLDSTEKVKKQYDIARWVKRWLYDNMEPHEACQTPLHLVVMTWHGVLVGSFTYWAHDHSAPGLRAFSQHVQCMHNRAERLSKCNVFSFFLQHSLIRAAHSVEGRNILHLWRMNDRAILPSLGGLHLTSSQLILGTILHLTSSQLILGTILHLTSYN